MDRPLKPIAIIFFVIAGSLFVGTWLMGNRNTQEAFELNKPEAYIATTTSPNSIVGVANQVATTTPKASTVSCFGDYVLTTVGPIMEGRLEGVGFVMQAPNDLTITDTSAPTELLHRSFTIQDGRQHQVFIKAFYLKNGDSIRLSSPYDPTVVFEPHSNTWWKEKWGERWFDRPETECAPNPAGTTIVGDPIYVTGAGDAGSYYRDYTIIFGERIKNPVSGYPEAIQIRIAGDANSVDYQAFKKFEQLIEQMILTAEPVINRG